MQKRKIDVEEYADYIMKALKRGVYLNSKAGDKVNSMVIGWGHVGTIWVRPVFVAYARQSRFTRELIDANPEFTVSVPMGDDFNRTAFEICGSKSGRDMDKIAESGLTLVEPEVVSVPAIAEFPLTLECRVIYREEQDSTRLPDDIRQQFYAEGDDHVSYYGEIVAAYIIED